MEGLSNQYIQNFFGMNTFFNTINDMIIKWSLKVGEMRVEDQPECREGKWGPDFIWLRWKLW